jgi:hypothetical protein
MAFQPVPDAAQVIIDTSYGSSHWSNSLWFTRNGYGPGDMDNLGVVVFTAWAAAFSPFLSTGGSINFVTIYDQRSDGAPVRMPAVVPVPGLSAGEADPLGDSAVITLYTDTRGRSGRGRLYIGGLTHDMRAGPEITSAVLTQLVNGVIATKNAGAGQGWLPVVVSRYHNNVKRAVAVTMTITSIVGRSGIVGSQDRRNRRP